MASKLVTLRALANYTNAQEHYPEGHEFDTDEEHAAWLMRDAPGCFEQIKPKPARKRATRNTAIKAEDTITK